MDHDEKKRIGQAIQRYIVERKLSREGFAHKTGTSLSNVNKMVTGLFTEKGLAKVEKGTGVRFRSRVSSERYGSYTFEEAERYQGTFEYLRYSFQDVATIHCYSMRIDWSEENACLQIRHKGIAESEFKQFGYISMPRRVPHILIVSNAGGLHNLNILGVMDFTRTMHGGLYTIGRIGEQIFAPRLVPVALCGTKEETETRYVYPKDQDYEQYKRLIETSREVVTLQASLLINNRSQSRPRSKLPNPLSR
ncbi:hypothetical protein [Rhizobium gallicum]|uniref:hypothetical protein n=1 Tax=Rhizobium gallicum TaxID=56730 RepID=UPI001EF8D9D5|nr:hypothetical protein [Rhizobium gallicum]ULJ76492.1 hypothetical protein L2W42_29400 [Rhizobium gallicum]